MVKKLRVTHSFYSLQGEGARIGRPSVFTRGTGCTLRCSNFGRCGKENICRPNEEVKEIYKFMIDNNITDTKDMPLAKTGCDSYYSSHPEFFKLSPEKTPEQLVKELVELTPNKTFRGVDLVITGGEPLMHQKFWLDVIKELYREYNLQFVTFESNGTVPIINGFTFELYNMEGLFVTLSLSPKMRHAGNPIENAWKSDAIKSYLDGSTMGYFDIYFKFVVSNEDDIDEIDEYFKHVKAGVRCTDFLDIFLMPLGGVDNDEFRETRIRVAKLAIEKGYSFSDRQHLSLFKNDHLA